MQNCQNLKMFVFSKSARLHLMLVLTPLVHLMPFSSSEDSASSMKVIRLSLLRSGGVMERPGEADGVATGVGLRLLRRMDCGVKALNTGPEAAKARARWKQNNIDLMLMKHHWNFTINRPTIYIEVSCIVSINLKKFHTYLLTFTTCGVCSRLSSGALLLLFGDTQELGNLGGLRRGRGVWQEGWTTKSISLIHVVVEE